MKIWQLILMIILATILLEHCTGCSPKYLVEPAESNIEMKYNVFEDQWSYEKKDAILKYNYLENRWEWISK